MLHLIEKHIQVLNKSISDVGQSYMHWNQSKLESVWNHQYNVTTGGKVRASD